MEVCERLYEGHKLIGDERRLGRLGLVMFMAGTLAASAVYADPAGLVEKADDTESVLSGEAGAGVAATGMAEGMEDTLMAGNRAFSGFLEELKIPAVSGITDSAAGRDITVVIPETPTAPVIPDIMDVSDLKESVNLTVAGNPGVSEMEESVTPIVPDISEEPAAPEMEEPVTPIVPDIPEEPAAPEMEEAVTPIVPDIPEEPAVPDMKEPAAPIAPENPAAPDAEDTPSGVEEPESGISDTGMVSINGYSVNEAGMICGIDDPQTAVEDGYMELPSEGCTGIAAGAFDDAPAGIREIYIPGNITVIEESALAGLRDMEWIEADPSGGYVSVDGVLFSENGTCLLAFPAGRIGTYKLPDHVTRVAVDAFRSSRLTAVDAEEGSLTDAGNLPETITLI